MAYKLYLDNIYDINNKEKETSPLGFNVLRKKDERELKYSFKIQEIDSLLCQFKSREDFVTELKKHKETYVKKDNKEYLVPTLVFENDGWSTKKEILYNNKFLARIALNFREKQRKAKSKEKIVLDKTDEISKFIKYVKSLATNETTRDFLLNPNKIDYLDSSDRKKLEKYFPSDIERYNKKEKSKEKIKPGLDTLLKEYLRYKKEYQTLRSRNESTLSIEADIRNINKEIENFFLENYQNIRSMLIWEEKYREILEKHINYEDVEEERYQIIKLQHQKVTLEKEVRNKESFRDEFSYIDEKELNDTLKEDKSTTLNNEDIEYLYKNGGIENIMNHIDLDDLYSAKYRTDAETLGIIPKKR